MNRYKCIIVVGASSGIGESIARRFIADGSKVFALSRSKTRLDSVKKSLNKEQQKLMNTYSCDIRDRSKTTKTISEIFERNDVDLVVCNAGVGYGKPFIKYSPAEIDTVIGTNLYGTINVVSASLKARQKDKFLQIVCTTSLAGKIGFPEMSVYSASKFGIEGFVESLRNEYRIEDVCFTLLRPGITATPFFKKAGMMEFQQKVSGLKSYFSPEKVADILVNNLTVKSKVIIVGNDKYFLALLPFIPFRYRFTILNLINKL